MVKIVLSCGWTHRGQTEFEGSEGMLLDVIKTFAAQYPDYRRRLLDTAGEPLTYFSVFLDDHNVPRHERKDVMVKHGSTVTIVPPLAGG
jgi:molybdopterin converting factor small subunit